MALTRTQVGRDGLRVQLENQFRDQFVGEMQIGKLQGNLLNTLYASHIRFLDSTGTVVAMVDAAVLEPSWFEFLSRTVSLSRITLVQPEVNLRYRQEDGWNISSVFRRRGDPTRALPWAFTSSDVRIMDGRVTTSTEGTLPLEARFDWLFDYAEAEITDIQARLNVEWRPDLKLLDLDRLSLNVRSEQLEVADLHGQFVWQDDEIGLNEVFLQMADARLHVAGYVENLDEWESAPGNVVVNLEMADSRVDHDALRRLFPKYPLADTMSVSTNIQGPLNALRIERLNVASGDFRISASGVLQGYPDSLDYALSLSNSRLSHPDLLRLYPSEKLGEWPGETVEFRSFDTRGKFSLNPVSVEEAFFSETLFELAGEWGELTGNFEINRPWKDSTAVFSGALKMDSLHMERLIPGSSLTSNLQGSLNLQGEGDQLDSLIADVTLGLSNSMIQDRSIDTLDAYVYVHNRVVAYDVMADQSQYGTMHSDGVVRLNTETPRAEIDIDFEQLDIGLLAQSDSIQTALNGLIQISMVGRDPARLRGTVDVSMDSSYMARGSIGRSMPPHEIKLSITDDPGGAQKIEIGGDMMELTANTSLDLPLLSSLGRLWSTSLRRGVLDVVDKEAVWRTESQNPELDATLDALYEEQLHRTARALFETREIRSPVEVEADFRIRDAMLFGAWMPGSPPIETNASGRLEWLVTPETMSLLGEIHADSLRIGGARFERLEGTYSIDVDRLQVSEKMFQAVALFQADSLQLAGQYIPSPMLDMTLADGEGALSIFTESSQRVGPQRLVTRLTMMPDRNRVYLEDVALSIGNSLWVTEEQTFVDVFGRTIEVPGIVMQSKSAEADILQRMHLSGVLSPLAGDTASFVIDNLALRPISQFLAMKQPMSGLLSGQLALTTSQDQPELTGAVHIDRFALDTRVLGNIDISSRYLPGQPDVGLQVEISPVPTANREELLPDAGLAAVYKENALLLDGTFRLPRFNPLATGFVDAGSLDLDLAMTRADVFFFELLFPNLLERADGYLTGSGTIGGDFGFPEFNAELALVDGEVSIPKFNLVFTDFEGPVRVDREGIHIDDATFVDPTGGSATISGGFLFNEYRFFSFDLVARLNELLIMNQGFSDELPFYGQVWASGTATLTGPTHSALLRSQDAVTRANSELFIPVTENEVTSDVGFLIFADSTGEVPDLDRLGFRRNLLSKRPEGERMFIDGLSMDLSIFAPSGSTLHLVFDPLLGDVINAVSSGRIQIQKKQGEFATYGTLQVESGDYLFTAGDVFARKFLIDRGGTITWDGDPINAALDIPASYRTRASTAGLPGNLFEENSQIPLVVSLDISGRVALPEVELSLRTDRSDRNYRGTYEGIETILNQSERIQEYATSVLLTNSFVLTTETTPNAGALTNSGNQIAFSSVSQLVASQLNRFLSEALPNMELNLGLQGESLEDPDLTYGVSLYLLDERVVVRGEGIYQSDLQQNQPGLEGEFEVEIRVSPNVSVSVFLRREGDVLSENALTSTRGAGLSYQTQFPSWRRFVNRLFGWLSKKKAPPPTDQVAEGTEE